MYLIKPSYEILKIEDNLSLLEEAGRTCYLSHAKEDSAEQFVKMIMKRGHLSVIEHCSMTVKFVTDRGISHELVRHRLASFSQESTRYCNYGNEGLTFILPEWVHVEPGQYNSLLNLVTDYSKIAGKEWFWLKGMKEAEDNYKSMIIDCKTAPQDARSVLPNSLKTVIVVTANFREWLHIFGLRCDSAAHPQMREIMIPLRTEVAKRIPVIFA